VSKRVRELLQIKINITTGGSAPPRPRVPYGSSNTETRQELHGRRWSDGGKGALECFRAGALPVLWAPEPEHAPHGASGAPEKIPPLTARMSGAVVDLVCSDQLSRGLRAWQARLRHPAGRLLGDCDLMRSTSASRTRQRWSGDARSATSVKRADGTALCGGGTHLFHAILSVA
jgi:hypothetical protein